MAGESLSYTELKNWYTTFNSVISNYGGSLSTKSVPSSGSQVIPSNINNLFTAINEMANEEYLGTQPSLYSTDYTVVASGNKINRSSITSVSNTASKITSIKCRNKISYSCGINSSGSYSSGTNSCGTNTSGTKTNTLCSSGTNSCGFNSQGLNSNGNNSNVYKSNGENSCGSKTVGLKANVLQSNGTKSNVNQTYGYCSSGSKSNSWNSNGTGCSNGTCSSSSKSCGAKSNVNKNNGSIIDILNANTSY